MSEENVDSGYFGSQRSFGQSPITDRGNNSSFSSTTSNTFVQRNFSCPYAKSSKLKHFSCQTVNLESIPRVKQHILQVHSRPKYFCNKCFKHFQMIEFLNLHILENQCSPKTSCFEDKINADQWEKITRLKLSKSQPPEVIWYEIFNTIFPQAPEPENPYSEQVLHVALSPALAHHIADDLFRLGLIEECSLEFVDELIQASATDFLQGQSKNSEHSIKGQMTSSDGETLNKRRAPKSTEESDTDTEDPSDSESSNPSNLTIGDSFNSIVEPRTPRIILSKESNSNLSPLYSKNVGRPAAELLQNRTLDQTSVGSSGRRFNEQSTQSSARSSLCTESFVDDHQNLEFTAIRDLAVKLLLRVLFQRLPKLIQCQSRSGANSKSQQSRSSKKRKAGSEKSGRKRRKLSTTSHNSDDDEVQKSFADSDCFDSRMTSSRLFACPFSKRDPRMFGSESPDERYRHCDTFSSPNIAFLKEHFKRRHYMPQYMCYICCEVVESESDLFAHQRPPPGTSNCVRLIPPLYQERIDVNMRLKLKLDEKNKPNFDEEKRWYDYYDGLFPGARDSRPVTPWFQPPVQAFLEIFHQFRRENDRQVIRVVAERLGYNINEEETVRLVEAVNQEASNLYLQQRMATLMPALGSSQNSNDNDSHDHRVVEDDNIDNDNEADSGPTTQGNSQTLTLDTEISSEMVAETIPPSTPTMDAQDDLQFLVDDAADFIEPFCPPLQFSWEYELTKMHEDGELEIDCTPQIGG